MFCKYCGSRMSEQDLVCPRCKSRRDPMQSSIGLEKLLGGNGFENKFAENKEATTDMKSGCNDEEEYISRAIEENAKMKRDRMDKDNQGKSRKRKARGIFRLAVCMILIILFFMILFVNRNMSGRIKKLDVPKLEKTISSQEKTIKEQTKKLTELEKRVAELEKQMALEEQETYQANPNGTSMDTGESQAPGETSTSTGRNQNPDGTSISGYGTSNNQEVSPTGAGDDPTE